VTSLAILKTVGAHTRILDPKALANLDRVDSGPIPK